MYMYMYMYMYVYMYMYMYNSHLFDSCFKIILQTGLEYARIEIKPYLILTTMIFSLPEGK